MLTEIQTDVAHGKVTTIPYEEAAAATRAADQQGTEERPERVCHSGCLYAPAPG